MRRPLFVNDLPLLFGQLDTKPGHDVHPCVVERGDKLLTVSITQLPQSPDAEKSHLVPCGVYMPSIAAIGGYTNQTGASYIQPNFGYVDVVGSYTFVDWGKRRNIIREREHLISMATLKLRQTQDDLRQKALRAYRDLNESYESLMLAQELVGLRKEAAANAYATAEANPSSLLEASKAQATAEADCVKADLAYRQAHIELSKLIGQ
jgi:outer membrane protein TolC